MSKTRVKKTEKKLKKQSQKNKKKRYALHDYIIIAFGIILIVLILICLFNSLMTLEKKDFYSYLIVSDHSGFDLNGTAITFGMISPGGSATRGIIAENGYAFPVEIKIIPRGEIADFVSKQKVMLNADERKEIGISAYAPEGTKYGNYTGTISVIVKRYILKR